MRKSLFLLAGLALALSLAAETTRTWEQKGYEDFEKGNAQKVSLRSDGRIQLAPRFRQLADPNLSYIWAIAEDKHANVYMAGGSPARIVRVSLAKGDKETALKPETFFTSKELEVHALAIDSDNNVYAATSPDPKVYKITPDGKSSVFYEPKAKYVWAMAFDPQGGLLVATGDKGEIYRVDRNGQGKVFYNSDEVHARSMVIDRQGNVILGTDPSGLIMRITPAGQAFTLYQSPKKEVTALETGPDGSIYAAVVGERPKSVAAPSAPIAIAGITINVGGPVSSGPTPPPPTPVAGGSDVYRIFPDGEPRRIWSSKDDVVYALATRADSTLLVGTGNNGKVYQVEARDEYTSLVKAQATQVTAFLKLNQAGNGANAPILAATSNSGKLMEIGSQFEPDGTFESSVFDARNFSQWGRVNWRAENYAGTAVTLYTRSGNVENPDRNWSPWSSALASPGQKSPSPGARFVQWKAVLTSAKGESSPWLDDVELAYLPKNVPPVMQEIDVTPPGYKFPTNVTAPQAAPTITLPALGQAKSQQPAVKFEAPMIMQQASGWQGVRWAATDDNDDTLVYSIFIRGKNEHNWKLLKDKVNDKFYAWDSTAFPDGVYVVKITASDSADNTAGEALSDSAESEPFVIDNTPPEISGLKSAASANKIIVAFNATDALSSIKKAEYSIDGGDWTPVLPVGRLSDSLQEQYSFDVAAGAGEHTIAVRVYDRVDNAAVAKTVVR